MQTDAHDRTSITQLATQHGLDLIPETITINEIGLDFRVAIATAHNGERWSRIPVARMSCPEPLLRATLTTCCSVTGCSSPRLAYSKFSVNAYRFCPGAWLISRPRRLTGGTWMLRTRYTRIRWVNLAQLHSIDRQQVADTGIDIRHQMRCDRPLPTTSLKYRQSFRSLPAC